MENTMKIMKNDVKWKMDILENCKMEKTCFLKCKTVKLPPIAPPLFMYCYYCRHGLCVDQDRVPLSSRRRQEVPPVMKGPVYLSSVLVLVLSLEEQMSLYGEVDSVPV